MEVVKNSPGTLGLSHFRNSRVATSLWEPIYQNLFTVQMTPPLGMGDPTANQERMNIILEGVQSVGTTNTSKASPTVSQNYKFATRRFAGGVPENTTVDITIDFELNLSHDNGGPENYTYKFLRQWVDLEYDPLTGHQGLKRDYVAENMIVTMHDRRGNPFWQWIFYYVFPTTAVPAPQLSYTQNDVLKGQMTFACDWWDECML